MTATAEGVECYPSARVGLQCRWIRTKSLSATITSPSAAAMDVAKKSCQLRS